MTITVSARIPEIQRQALIDICNRDDKTLNQVLSKMIEDKLQNRSI